MCIHMPKFAARMMGASSGEMVAKLIEKRMITPTLERFRQLVMRDEEETMAAHRETTRTTTTTTDNTNNTLEQQRFLMMQDDCYEYQRPKLTFPDHHHQEEEEREMEVNMSDEMFIPSHFSPVVPQDS
jgi:hypothetical protein